MESEQPYYCVTFAIAHVRQVRYHLGWGFKEGRDYRIGMVGERPGVMGIRCLVPGMEPQFRRIVAEVQRPHSARV